MRVKYGFHWRWTLILCASLLQVNGEFDTVQEALFQITSRLQEHFFRDAFPSMNRPTNPRFLDHIPPFPSYRGRRELSPAGMYPSMGPPFHQFDGIGGLPPRGGFHPHDDRPPYMPNFHRSGVRPPVSERMPSSGPWVPQVSTFNTILSDPSFINYSY